MEHGKELDLVKGLTVIVALLGTLCPAFFTGLAASPPKSVNVGTADGSKARVSAASPAKGEVLVKFKKGDVTPR